jgi:hypothetical protein
MRKKRKTALLVLLPHCPSANVGTGNRSSLCCAPFVDVLVVSSVD